MSEINVLVASTSPDVKAEIIASSVKARPDMDLVRGRRVRVEEVDDLLESIGSSTPCAVILVGPYSETNSLAHRWLAERDGLVIMHVDVVDDTVRIGLRDPRLDSLLTALRELVERVGTQRRERVARIQLRSVRPSPVEEVPPPDEQPPHEQPPDEPPERPLLESAINWVHALLRDAVESVSDENGDVHGFSITRATLLQSIDAPSPRVITNQRRELDEAAAALDSALVVSAENPEPLAVAKRVFRLDPLEFRLMVLALAPELDFRFQRCIGFLLDEMSRRVGTISLYSSLLGLTARVRGELINSGGLAQWFVFEDYAGRPAAADEPLRLDPFLTEWLLGDCGALENDPRVRRTMRLEPWPGANVLQRPEEHAKADRIIEQLKTSPPHWVVLDADDPAAWRALLEIGSDSHNVKLKRIEATRLAGVDIIEIEQCARRIGRMAQLTRNPLAIDVTKAEGTEAEDESLRVFLATLIKAECSAAVICRDEARIVRLLEPVSYELVHEPPLSMVGRAAAMRAAAKESGAHLTEEAAETLANRFPLQVDGLEHAMELARARPENLDLDDPSLARFITACKELSSEGISHLVDRIEPVFTLDDVVLPTDRKQQLIEIVDNVRFASRVLDGWKFRDQLPYGRGVTALFYGSSGTGKTMAATGVSRALGVQMLRLDLSRVVSKYIGDTEKNIDQVFTDAQKSGAAILIDEADALFGKRSEVKDAHDRYANIEVAYLLQRMEAYEGLAILTTNMRKNLDPAFLRRLRFIVDFPRPNVESREQIWRQCLPEGSHEVDDTEFRQLARRLDLTGGQIRQITLRAAFLAAAADDQITLEHIAHAARAELAKLGLPPVEIDLTQTRRAA